MRVHFCTLVKMGSASHVIDIKQQKAGKRSTGAWQSNADLNEMCVSPFFFFFGVGVGDSMHAASGFISAGAHAERESGPAPSLPAANG